MNKFYVVAMIQTLTSASVSVQRRWVDIKGVKALLTNGYTIYKADGFLLARLVNDEVMWEMVEETVESHI